MNDEKSGKDPGEGSMGVQEPVHMPRKRAQKRIQLRDPINPGRRISLTGPQHLVDARAEHVRSVRFRLQHNAIPVVQARREIAAHVGGSPLVKDIYMAHVRAYPGESSAEHARSLWAHHLEEPFGKSRIAELEEEQMRAWEERESGRGYAPLTIFGVWAILRAAIHRAMRSPSLGVDCLPWGAYKPKPPTDTDGLGGRGACVTLDELEALIRAAVAKDQGYAVHRRGGHHPDYAAKVIVFTLCGLRQGEAAGLAWDALELGGQPPLLHVRCQAHVAWQRRHPDWARPKALPKGRKQRVIVLHDAARATLEAHRASLIARGLYRFDGPVFPRRDGTWRADACVLRPHVIREIAKAAGLPDWETWVTHSTRHTFSFLEVRGSGGDLEASRRRTGHADPRHLVKYIDHARGLPAPAIRSLPADIIPEAPPMKLLTEGALTKAASPLSSALTALASSAIPGPTSKVHVSRHQPKVGASLDLAALAEAWLGEKHTSERPEEISAWGRRLYNRAYMAALRAPGGTTDDAKRRGIGSQKAFFARWGRELKRVDAARRAAEGNQEP